MMHRSAQPTGNSTGRRGAGLTIIEVQQNSDTTYRLYDYGRPRELHLDDGIAVSDPELRPIPLAEAQPRPPAAP